MKSDLQFKFLSALNTKKSEKGFTLIELLVVVIIIGVLAAVALPNLLAQVGKAREVEGKNAVGTANRSQQAYHFEAQVFTDDIGDAALGTTNNALGVVLNSQYYTFAVTAGASPTDAKVIATPANADDDGVRGYGGAITYGAGDYSTSVCQGTAVGNTPAVADISGNGGCGTYTELD